MKKNEEMSVIYVTDENGLKEINQNKASKEAILGCKFTRGDIARFLENNGEVPNNINVDAAIASLSRKIQNNEQFKTLPEDILTKKQKYYIGLGTKDAEWGWIYKGTGVETDSSIELLEEYTMSGTVSDYEKVGVAEITKEEYYSVASELEKEDFDEYAVAERIDKVINRIKGNL